MSLFPFGNAKDYTDVNSLEDYRMKLDALIAEVGRDDKTRDLEKAMEKYKQKVDAGELVTVEEKKAYLDENCKGLAEKVERATEQAKKKSGQQ